MARRRTRLMIVLVAGFLVAQAAVNVYLLRPAPTATLLCRATNAGTPLAAKAARVFVYAADGSADVRAEGSTGEPLALQPGQYHVRVLLTDSGDQQTALLKDIEIKEEERLVKEVEFAAGELAVDVEAGAKAEGEVVVYIFRPGDANNVVTTFRADERTFLAEGTYDLRVVLTVNSEEKGVTRIPGVEVRAGRLTRPKIQFTRGTLFVEARNTSNPLRPGQAKFTLYRAGDDQLQVVDTGTCGHALGVPAGQYDLRVEFTDSNDKPVRWRRNITIEASKQLSTAVEFSSGALLIRAAVGSQQLERFDAYVYVYRTADHREPVTYAPAGERMVVSSGRYDLRVHYFRSQDGPDTWLRAVDVAAGETVERTVTFASGRLLVRAFDAAGTELIGDNVFVFIHAAGERTRPIATARTGRDLTLTAGTYDVRVEETRTGAERWIEDVVVETGKRTEFEVRPGG